MGSWGRAGAGERQSESLPCRLYYYFLSSCSCCLPKVLVCQHILTCLHYHPTKQGLLLRRVKGLMMGHQRMESES